jgi:hypothetical protein
MSFQTETCKQGCDWHQNDGLSCSETGNSCSQATFLTAEPSTFHDEYLIQATQEINEILDRLPKDADGRKLSFVHTRMGTLLAWVRHGAKSVPPGAVTAEDDDATIAKALNLKGYAAAGAGQV